MAVIRIGTRRSQLALWQANFVAASLKQYHPTLEIELVEITTQGDKTLDIPLAGVGGKGLFLKELEQALLNKRIDIAVHSMKDVTVTLPEGLHIPVICQRANPCDAFVSNLYHHIDELPDGAKMGTCSARRQSLLKHAYPHLELVNLRGNVNTRLKRLDDGDYDAIILACAGLERLEMQSRIKQALTPEQMLPAVGQGAVGIECRQADTQTLGLIKPLNHLQSQFRVLAERAANEKLNGGCHVPVALYATLDTGAPEDKQLWLRGQVCMPDGSRLLQAQTHGRIDHHQLVGSTVGQALIDQGAGKILQHVYRDAARQ